MATKETKTEATKADIAETAATAKAVETDPFKVMKKITLPRAGMNEQNFRFVGVNGRFYQVPRGVETEVPEPVYEVLMNAQRAEESAEKYIKEMLDNK